MLIRLQLRVTSMVDPHGQGRIISILALDFFYGQNGHWDHNTLCVALYTPVGRLAKRIIQQRTTCFGF